MANESIHQEFFHYQFEGKEYSYRVDELEDGFWRIICDHELFRLVNGSNTITNARSVIEALQNIGMIHQSLADAMLEPFVKKSKLSINAYTDWMWDRRTFYHLN